MKRRDKAHRQGVKDTNRQGMDEAFADTKDPSTRQAPKVHSAATPALGNTDAIPPSVLSALSTTPASAAEADKPGGGILTKKKHRHRRHHRDKKSADKPANPNRKLSGEAASTKASHAGTGPRGSVVSVDVPVIQPPQALPASATMWPAPTGPADLQQVPFDGQPQMYTQMQQPIEFQPQMAQPPPDVHWQQQQQQQQQQLLQLPQQPGQPPLIPAVGFPPEPVPLQPAPTILPPYATTSYAAAEAPHVKGASTTGSLSDVSQASVPISSTSFIEQPTAGFQSSLQQMPMCAMPPVLAGEQPQLQGSGAQQGASTLTADGNLAGSTIAPMSFSYLAAQTGGAERTRGERETTFTFNSEVNENVLDDQSIDYTERDDAVEDIATPRQARSGSVTRQIRKPRTSKHRRRASVSHQKKGKPSSTADSSPQPFDSAIPLVSEPVPPTAVIINAEMAQRLIAALQKCEGQPPKEATVGTSEPPQAKPETIECDSKLATPAVEVPTKTPTPKSSNADKLGSSEEFYEVIAEEVVEPDKNTEGGQRKRVIRKTTRSRKHDVIEEPWDDDSAESMAIPTLPRWEDIQPSTSRGTGRGPPPALCAHDVDDTEEESAAPITGASRVRSASGRPSHANDDRERTAAPTSKDTSHARRDERRPAKLFPTRRYPPPPFYSLPGPLFPYDPSLTRQPFQPATHNQHPYYAGPSWLQSRPDRYNEYYQYYGASAPYMNPNVIQMAQDNAIPAAHHFNPEQPSQRYLPFPYEAPRGRSQGFQGSQRKTTGGRPGGTRLRDFSNARCGRPCQPYTDGMAGPETQVGGSRLCHQAAAPITPQADRGPGFQVTAKPQSQRNFEITGPKHPRCSSKSSEFRAAVPSQPQESFCWERETPASKSGVPRAPSCRERDCSAAATTRPAAVDNPSARSRTSAVRHPPVSSAPSSRNCIQGAQSAGQNCARVAPCGCRCHEGRATPVRGGVTLDELLRREDDVRRDEQLRQLSQQLKEERIRRDAEFAARVELLDALQLNADAEATLERDVERDAVYGTYCKDSSANRRCSKAGLQ